MEEKEQEHFRKKKSKDNLGSPVPLGTIANKAKLTVADAKFIFEQAEKVLKHTLEDSNTIVSRTTTLVTILSTLIVAFFGFLIKDIATLKHLTILDWTCIVGILYIVGTLGYTYENLKPPSYLVTGSWPKDLFIDAFFNPAIKDEYRIISYYVSEFENYQFRIERNSEINRIRWKIYKTTLNLLIWMVFVLLITYLAIGGYITHAYEINLMIRKVLFGKPR